MMDAIRQITISEVILVFLLLFLLPLTALLLRRLRRYEAQFGDLPDPKPKAAEREPGAPPGAPTPGAGGAAAAADPDAVPDNVFPYKSKKFLSPSDRACLTAMQDALGDEVDVFPKVALWELIESTDKKPGYLKRLHDKDYDFLVCDKRTGQPLTAVMYNPGKGRPAGKIDEIKKICKAAAAPVVFIDQAAEYDADSLKEALGLPDLDI